MESIGRLLRDITYDIIYFDVLIMWPRVNDVIGKYAPKEVNENQLNVDK